MADPTVWGFPDKNGSASEQLTRLDLDLDFEWKQPDLLEGPTRKIEDTWVPDSYMKINLGNKPL